MPRISTLLSDQNIHTGSTGPQASPESFAGGITPGAANQIAGALDTVGETLIRRDEANNKIWAQDSFIDAQMTWDKRMQELRQTGADPEAVRKEFSTYTQKVALTAPNENAGNLFQQHMQPYAVNVFNEALHINAKKTVETYSGKMKSNMDALVGQAAEDPSTFADVIKQINETGSNYKEAIPMMGPVIDKTVEGAKANAAMTAIDKLLETDPDGADAFVKGVTSKLDLPNPQDIINGTVPKELPLDYLPPDIAKAKQLQIDQGVGVQKAVTQEFWNKTRKDNMKSLQETGRPIDGYDINKDAAANGKNPDAAKAIRSKLLDMQSEALANFQVKNELYGKSITDMQTVVESKKPVAGSADFASQQRVYVAAQKTANALGKLINPNYPSAYDPVLYSQNAPMVAAQKSKGTAMITQAQSEADPVAKNNMIKQGQSLVNQSVEASMQIQRAIGIPEADVAVLSRTEAAHYASTVKDGLLINGLQVFQEINSTYGSNAEKAYADMQRLPDKERLPAKYMAVAAHLDSDPGFAATLLQALKADTPLQGKPSVNSTLMDSKVETHISDAVAGDATFQSYQDAVVASSGKPDYAADVKGAIDAYAKLLYRGQKGVSAEQVAGQATAHVLGSLYSFGTSNNGTSYVIPRAGRTDYELENIHQNLNQTLLDISRGSSKYMSTIDVSSLGPRAGDTEQDARYAGYGLAVKGYWVTNPANTGVYLYYNDADSKLAQQPGVPVRTKSGQPFFVPFREAFQPDTQQATPAGDPMDRLDPSRFN